MHNFHLPFKFTFPSHNYFPFPSHNFICKSISPSFSSLHPDPHGAGGGGGNNDDNNGGKGDRWSDDDNRPDPDNSSTRNILLIFISFLSSPAIAETLVSNEVWEIRGGKRTRIVPDADFTSFVVVDGDAANESTVDKNKKDGDLILGLESCWRQIRDLFCNLMLPEGYPSSVSSDYMQYSLWRGLQGIASQISGVLATQSLLYAIGLGKGAIPAAAAVNWVLKDGIGYLSKILLSNFGRHFDVNPKGWRLFADLLENAAFGLEIMTPAFPQYFVLIGAAAGAGRSAATLIQAATRSCFYAGFAVQRNSAEVIAKGEAQGMVSKFIGIMLGIALANFLKCSTPLALASFAAVTGFHMYCNLKSYQSIQLRTLNPYRASLVFSEYLVSGLFPQIKHVNDEEPFYPGLPLVNTEKYIKSSGTLSIEARNAAAEICSRLRLGCKLSEIVKNKEDAFALLDLFKKEGYIVTDNKGKFCVILREGCSPQDMLKSLFHVSCLYWLEKNIQMESRSIADECKYGERLHISLDYVQRKFDQVKRSGLEHGWLVNDGLIARPLPFRMRVGYTDS